MKKILFYTILFLGFFNIIWGQKTPDSTQIESLKSLKLELNNKISINWNEKKGTPNIITLSNPIQFNKIPYKSATIFLQKIKGVFKERINKDSLVLLETKQNNGNMYFRYQQTYKGLKVLNGNYVITILDNGKVQSALGEFSKNIEVETVPEISIDEALKLLIGKFSRELELRDTLISSELIVYPQKDNYYLAWELKIPSSKNITVWTCYVDAITGELLSKQNDLIYDNAKIMLLPQSQTYAYSRHPGLDASYSYISPVPHLYNNGLLQGTYTYIYNDAGSEAYSALNDFRYSSSDLHFDESNLYYHIDKFRNDFWNNLGFNLFTQIIAHANHAFYDYYGNPSPNASYSSTDHHLRFSNGQGVSGFNSFAREDKIIYHEYTHAVTDYVANLSYGASESGAIHEGNSDYFPASFTNRTIIGEYAAPAYQRDITDPVFENYTEYQNDPYYPSVEPHDGGELWSACLWDLRSNPNIGQYYSDRLIYNGLYALPTTATFLQYRQAIINWDNSHYNGSHLSAIIHTFYLRGIGTDNISVTISGPSMLDFKETGTWTANVSGGTGSHSYAWYKSTDGGSTWAGPYGTTSTYSNTMLFDDFMLKCVVNDIGTNETKSDTHTVEYNDGDVFLPKIVEGTKELPKTFELEANYPNPFNPSTQINYQIPKDGFVNLVIYNTLGQVVSTLVNKQQTSGYYSIQFNASNLPSGVYIYKIQVGEFTSTKKMLLTK